MNKELRRILKELEGLHKQSGNDEIRRLLMSASMALTTAVHVLEPKQKSAK